MRFGVLALVCACSQATRPAPAAKTELVTPLGEEKHFASLQQLTFGGENAEAYWAFSGQELVMQAHVEPQQCDRIYKLGINGQQTPLSSGDGATTCAFFLPGDKDVIYASTHLGGKACPPKPDRSLGYVWALYPSYDIFKKTDQGLQRLTETDGYDAEATVCKDGSVVFTSVRDGDLELYRMDSDGKNVKRLTHTPGYDGGAFFSPDCSKIVWRASRPKPGPELDDYKKLLAQHLVRPSKLELYVANADGSDATQITYLDAASFAPFFHPSGKRIVFSSNFGDPRGREFDLWAINTDGTALERITHAKGFDGFPMFSPDGRTLAFSSNRATAEGKSDTNVFLAAWTDAPVQQEERAEDRIKADLYWLADPLRGGRGTGDEGGASAAAYIEEEFKAAGLHVEKQKFLVTTKIETKKAVVKVGNQTLKDVRALAISAPGSVKGKLVSADYGLQFKEVKNAIVLVRRFVPEGTDPALGDLRKKAWAAREAGAKALLVVDLPDVPKDKMPAEAAPPAATPESYANSGIPVLLLKRDEVDFFGKKHLNAELEVVLEPVQSEVYNVVGRLDAWGNDEAIVLGAHYDHLGMGGRHSLAPDLQAPHVGADDNGSGSAALIEIAHALSKRKTELRRDVYLVAFAAEELGVLGSTHFVRQLGKLQVKAMLNMDMIGRMRENKVQVLGSESAEEWGELLASTCAVRKLDCHFSGNGYGPSDQTPFFAAGVPVLHFFTGAHGDYHKPSDTPEKINYAGVAAVAQTVIDLAVKLSRRETGLTFKAGAPSLAMNADRRSFNASLGTVPDYAGPAKGQRGVLLAGVRPGSAADKAGLKRGDVLQKLGTHMVGSVEDLMFALNASKPGETVRAVVLRDGAEHSVDVTFEERARK